MPLKISAGIQGDQHGELGHPHRHYNFRALFESLVFKQPADFRRLQTLQTPGILDEVQTLRAINPALLSMMKTLADDGGVTFLFCSATLPRF
jgi:CRISPR/Cas system-associated endonuclease/helicase Cas3